MLSWSIASQVRSPWQQQQRMRKEDDQDGIGDCGCWWACYLGIQNDFDERSILLEINVWPTTITSRNTPPARNAYLIRITRKKISVSSGCFVLTIARSKTGECIDHQTLFTFLRRYQMEGLLLVKGISSIDPGDRRGDFFRVLFNLAQYKSKQIIFLSLEWGQRSLCTWWP